MKPIIFSTDMVRAILDGRKTQTRCVLKPQPQKVGSGIGSEYLFYRFAKGEHKRHVLEENFPVEAVNYAPHEVGDVLYVKETWCKFVEPHHVISGIEYAYKADCTELGESLRKDYVKAGFPYKWCSSIHMPKAAARIFLRVTGVRVERLKMIAHEDIKAEGIRIDGCTCNMFDCEWCMTGQAWHWAEDAFVNLWDGLYAKRGYGWATNPWVFVYEFERIEKP